MRFAGFEELQAAGPKALPTLITLSRHQNPWLAARAVWLLPYAGPDGVKELRHVATHRDPRFRVTAIRAAFRNGPPGLGLELAKQLSDDPSLHVRRTILTNLRDIPYTQKKELLLRLAGKGLSDRTYLEDRVPRQSPGRTP